MKDAKKYAKKYDLSVHAGAEGSDRKDSSLATRHERRPVPQDNSFLRSLLYFLTSLFVSPFNLAVVILNLLLLLPNTSLDKKSCPINATFSEDTAKVLFLSLYMVFVGAVAAAKCLEYYCPSLLDSIKNNHPHKLHILEQFIKIFFEITSAIKICVLTFLFLANGLPENPASRLAVKTIGVTVAAYPLVMILINHFNQEIYRGHHFDHHESLLKWIISYFWETVHTALTIIAIMKSLMDLFGNFYGISHTEPSKAIDILNIAIIPLAVIIAAVVTAHPESWKFMSVIEAGTEILYFAWLAIISTLFCTNQELLEPDNFEKNGLIAICLTGVLASLPAIMAAAVTFYKNSNEYSHFRGNLLSSAHEPEDARENLLEAADNNESHSPNSDMMITVTTSHNGLFQGRKTPKLGQEQEPEPEQRQWLGSGCIMC